MKHYTVDFEFDGHQGPLISVALVSPDGRGFYGSTHHQPTDSWVAENVIPILDDYPVTKVISYMGDEKYIRQALQKFVQRSGEDVAFYADSPVDIARLADMLSTGPDGRWQSCNMPYIVFRVYNENCWPNNLGPLAKQHNAYWDALALWEKLRDY